jgi:hypothetical protein
VQLASTDTAQTMQCPTTPSISFGNSAHSDNSYNLTESSYSRASRRHSCRRQRRILLADSV